MTEARPIGELVSAVIDYRGKTPPKAESGIPLITAKVIKGGRIEPIQEYISEETYAWWMRRGLPSSGDVLVTTEAPLGEVAQVPRDDRIALAQRVILLRPDPAKVDPQFFFHFLRSPDALSRLRQRSSGTTVAGIRQPELKAVEVDLLERSAQEIVGRVLDALDGLIENNRLSVDVLEEMARSIYREWFVNFRFPGHEGTVLVDSALGPIPDGWNVASLGSVAEVNPRSRTPSEGEVIRYLDISALGDRTVGSLNEVSGGEAPGRARRVVQPGDVVWSMVRPNRRAHALLVDPGPEWIASTGLAVLSATGVSSTWLFETTSTQDFTDYLVSQEGGSAYPAVKPKDFQRALVVVPGRDVDQMFADRVAPMHRLGWSLREQGSALAALRDALLPKLVAGEIDVSHVDLDALSEAAIA